MAAKAKAPEEFFEVLRSAMKEKQDASAGEGKDRPAPAEAGTEQPGTASQAPAEPAERTSPSEPSAERSFPLSVFAENESTVTIRRSTLIFSFVVIAILLFISYALGKRVGRPPARPHRTTVNRNGLRETRRPALPAEFRSKCVICLRVFDHTEDAAPANARAYRDFLNTSPDAAFVRAAGKEAFIISYKRKLLVCVGPVEGATAPEVNSLLPKLRNLRHNGVLHFAHAGVEPLPRYAKLFE